MGEEDVAKEDVKEEPKSESACKDEVAELKAKLADAETKAGEYLQLAQRKQADFDNYRKRTQRENEEFRLFATSDLIKEMLSIVDDFDRALATVKEDNDLTIGIKGIRANMLKMLESKGLKEIPTEGKFDPAFHEAFCVVEGEEDGNIAEVFQKGYTLGGKVLRYAKVKVTKKAEAKVEEPGEQAPAETDNDKTE